MEGKKHSLIVKEFKLTGKSSPEKFINKINKAINEKGKVYACCVVLLSP